MNYSDAVDMPEMNGDAPISLEELGNLIPELQKKYGKHAKIVFDAGYNNVTVMVIPTKKKVKQK